MICNNDICCPVCRALCCVFNESDTCMKFTPGEAPGYDCPDFLCRKEPGGRRTGKNDYPKKTDILTFMMEQEKDESKRQFHETYPEMARRRNASLPPAILVLDDFD